MLLEERSQRFARVEPNCLSVAAHECPPEDPSRPARQLIPLEIAEQTDTDLRTRGNALEGDATPLALGSHPAAKPLVSHWG
jgi:hypothetical protein